MHNGTCIACLMQQQPVDTNSILTLLYLTISLFVLHITRLSQPFASNLIEPLTSRNHILLLNACRKCIAGPSEV